jgi:hypothetical protein
MSFLEAQNLAVRLVQVDYTGHYWQNPAAPLPERAGGAGRAANAR